MKYLKDLEGHVHPSILSALRDLESRIRQLEPKAREPEEQPEKDAGRKK